MNEFVLIIWSTVIYRFLTDYFTAIKYLDLATLGMAKLLRLAARGRQNWLSFFCRFWSISQQRFRLEAWNV